MNLYRVLIQEVDDSAALLMRRLLFAKQDERGRYGGNYWHDPQNQSKMRLIFRGAAIKPEDWKYFPKAAHVVLKALIRHANGEPLTTDEQRDLTRALNKKILGVDNQVGRTWPPYFLAVTAELPRMLADMLVDYLSLFHRDPRLLKNKPIGLCPTCQGLFLKLKSNQKYCCSNCRSKDWAKQNPGYWDSEQIKKQKKARQRRKK